MSKYIVSNPNILGGVPIIAGTRIPAKQILNLFREGYTIEAIHEEYPQLSIQLINRVIDEIIQNIEIQRA